MSDHVGFLDLLGVDEHLLHTSDARAIALVHEDEGRPFGRLFIASDGRVVLRTGDMLRDPCDFTMKVKN